MCVEIIGDIKKKKYSEYLNTVPVSGIQQFILNLSSLYSESYFVRCVHSSNNRITRIFLFVTPSTGKVEKKKKEQ